VAVVLFAMSICSLLKVIRLFNRIYPITKFILLYYKGSLIKCSICSEDFPKSKCLRNLNAEQMLRDNFHLNREHREIKQSVNKMIDNFETLLDEFKSCHLNFLIGIDKQFTEIRRKIDLQREEFIEEKIDKIALRMIDEVKQREKYLIKRYEENFSQIVSDEHVNRCKRLLEEFREPNIAIKRVKKTMVEHESGLVELKREMFEYKIRTNQIQDFYFSPDESMDEKTFGVLNLSPQKLISSSTDDTVKIWDLNTFKCAMTLNAHDDDIYCLEKVSNQQFLSSSNGTIKLWDNQRGDA